MEITSVFGLSFRLKHSFQTQLLNHSRCFNALLLFTFHCLTRISLGGWITPYSFVFHTFAVKVTQNIPARKHQISRRVEQIRAIERKKNSVNAFHGNEWMKEHTLYALQSRYTSSTKYDAKHMFSYLDFRCYFEAKWLKSHPFLAHIGS